MNKPDMKDMYHDRLSKLNENAPDRSVWSSIDRPIRPLVYHLTRLGYQTIWSCCGFAYKGEEEPKSHANYTYVVVEPKDLRALTWLANISRQHGWHVRSHYCTKNHSWWILMYEHERSQGKYKWQSQEEGLPAIHDYEDPLLAIASLIATLRDVPTPNSICEHPNDRDYNQVTELPPLKDGNAIQREIMPELADEWQVEPKTKGAATPAAEGYV